MNEWRYALRSLRRDKLFALAATATLALGIGANTAIFSFFNTVYLRPLPYPEPDRLVATRTAKPEDFERWRQSAAFTGVAAWGWDVVTLTGGADWPERVQVQRITPDYLRVLGINPYLGRTFHAHEGGCPVLISARLWRGWFASDPQVVGRPVTAEKEKCEVVGVMPEGFLPPASASNHVDAWMPLSVDPADRKAMLVLARLAPGVSAPFAPGMRPLKEFVAGTPKAAMYAVAGAAGFILLLACLNVATLLSARVAARRQETVIRAALGASRWQLMRQPLIQALLLAAVGGAAAVAGTFWSLDGLVLMAHGVMPRLDEAQVDWRVLLFAFVLSIATGLAFGLIPAIRISRWKLPVRLGADGRGFWSNAQIAAEVALAFILLAGAGLLLRSFQAIRAVDLGFATEHVLSANFALPPEEPARHVRFLTDVLEHVRAVPGVVSATATLGVPMRGSAGGNFEVFGQPVDPGEKLDAAIRPGDAAYLTTRGMRLERGRGFSASDIEGAPRVALVNERMVRQIFPNEDPLGRRIRISAGPWMTIVGIVHETHHVGPTREGMREIYVPYLQFSSTNLRPRALIVRTVGSMEEIVPALQRAVAAVDKNQPLVSVSSMEESLAEFIAPQRFDAQLMAIFASLGLVLAAVGIFAVVSLQVTRRTRELGVRMALGAERGVILRLVLGEGLRTVMLGLAFGLCGSWLLTRYLRSLLFGVTPTDPVTLAAVCVAVLVTAGFACALPAWRAGRVDPVVALRSE